MIIERGKVSELRGDHAWVECQSRAACERCARGQGCGGGVLGALLGDRLHRIRVRVGDTGVQVGDQVELGMSATSLLGGALLVYMLPLSGLMLGALAAGYLAGFRNDGITVISGVAGLLAASWLARRIQRGARTGYQPEILHNLGPCKASGETGRALASST